MAIDSAFLKIALRNNTENSKIHFVCAGQCIWWDEGMRSHIQKGMERHGFDSVMLTILYMSRWKLITKHEMMEIQRCFAESINDELESFLEDLKLNKQPIHTVRTYFLPSLTDEELELVEQKDSNYLDTFLLSHRPDAEVLNSKSESKFVKAINYRETYLITCMDTSPKNCECCSIQ